MSGELQRHLARLGVVCAAIIASTLIYGGLVYFVPLPMTFPLPQATHLLWVLGVIAVLNLVTLTPVHRAMLAGPLRVYAAGQELAPLLRAHFTAQVVLFARLEAIAIIGLILYFVTGRRDAFLAFAGVALIGMLAQWPSRDRVGTALGLVTSATPEPR